MSDVLPTIIKNPPRQTKKADSSLNGHEDKEDPQVAMNNPDSLNPQDSSVENIAYEYAAGISEQIEQLTTDFEDLTLGEIKYRISKMRRVGDMTVSQQPMLDLLESACLIAEYVPSRGRYIPHLTEFNQKHTVLVTDLVNLHFFEAEQLSSHYRDQILRIQERLNDMFRNIFHIDETFILGTTAVTNACIALADLGLLQGVDHLTDGFHQVDLQVTDISTGKIKAFISVKGTQKLNNLVRYFDKNKPFYINDEFRSVISEEYVMFYQLMTAFHFSRGNRVPFIFILAPSYIPRYSEDY